MGKVMNAMLISSTTEYLASYIEAKTKQAGLDAMEYAYKAVAAAASGQWHLAAGFAQAGAGALALGAGGALAAGYVRSLGQERADNLMAQDTSSAFEYNDEDIEGSGQRRKASGVVQQRPISIVVNSVMKIEAGLIVFPDGSQEAAEQFYRNYTRDQIQADLEAGVLVVA